jgi:hypothetical protein
MAKDLSVQRQGIGEMNLFQRETAHPFLLFPSTGSIFKVAASALDVFLDANLSLCPGRQGDREERRGRGVRDNRILDLLVVLLQSRLRVQERGAGEALRRRRRRKGA